MTVFEVFGIQEDSRSGVYTAEVMVVPPIEGIAPDLGHTILEAEYVTGAHQFELIASDRFEITEKARVAGAQHLRVTSTSGQGEDVKTLNQRLETLEKYHDALTRRDTANLADVLGLGDDQK